MDELSTFFRHCPSCGRRFEIRLVGRKLVDDRKTTEEIKEEAVAPAGLGTGGGYGGGSYVYVEEKVPVTIDVKDFDYTYKCRHCGHVWTELREKES